MAAVSYEEFHSATLKWIDAFGLTDWLIDVEFSDLGPESQNTAARTYTNWTQRNARIVLNSTFQIPGHRTCHERNADALALHEVLHVVLTVLGNTAAAAGDYTADRVDSEEHAVIRRVMRAMQIDPTLP